MIETEEAKYIPVTLVATYHTAGTQIRYFITTHTRPLLRPVAIAASGAYAKPDQKSAMQIQD